MALRRYFSLVKFSHSIFALPFALQGAWMASGGVPELSALVWVVFCAVAARTAAMGFNRLLDRRIDAENPRTAMRELPSGAVSTSGAAALVAISAVLFVFGAFRLNPLCGYLALPVLAVLFSYSAFKRFSSSAHLVLGLSLAIAPLGAWLAIRGDFHGDLRPVLALAFGVLLWVAGFDLIYACQDVDFDRERGLHSIPARIGTARALQLAKTFHLLAFGAFFAQGLLMHAGVPFWLGLAAAGSLLVWEHRLVRPGDLSKIDAAFFTANGWVGVGLFVGLALDLSSLGAA
jgi:4-hydroxybenzoate polyprenyltransferase